MVELTSTIIDDVGGDPTARSLATNGALSLTALATGVAPPSTGKSPGIAIWLSSGSQLFWLVKKPGGGGLLVQINRDVIITTDSVAGSSEVLRPTKVYDLVDAACFRTYSSRVGTWSATTISAATMGYTGVTGTSWSGGGSFVAQTTSTLNDNIDYIVTPDEFGEVSIAFLCGNATGSVNISVVETGETLVTGLRTDRVGGSSYPWIYTLKTRHKEQITLRITNAEAKTISIFGAQWYFLGDPRANTRTAKYNAWVYWRTDNHFSDSNGASDYAIREALGLSNKWAGSVHGGQTLVGSASVTLNGRSLDASDSVRMGTDFIIQQKSVVSWVGVTGGTSSLDVYQVLSYTADGTEDLTVSMQGSVNHRLFYTLMNTTSSSFTEVIHPKYINVAVDGDYNLGNTNSVIQRNPITKQLAYTFSTSREGVFVRQASSAGYAKVYGGPSTDILETPGTIENISWSQKRIWSN